ncbi:MAG: small, acid-soluble spore protein, alpha/beta type [Halanaerobiales bacterium]
MGTGQKSNTLINPLAAQAMEKFKYEVANELGIQIPQSGYYGNMTTRDTGAIGGHMVRKMIEAYQNSLVNQSGQQF